MKTRASFFTWLFLSVLVATGWGSSPVYSRVDKFESGRSALTRTDNHDKDATGGVSLLMDASKRANGWVADSYSYPPYPGRYRFTWRLKIDKGQDTGRPIVTLMPRFGDQVKAPEGSDPDLNIEDTDFEKPGVYQDFTREVVVPENQYGGGFVQFDCSANRSVWWDNLKYELLECYDDPRVVSEWYEDFTMPRELKRSLSNEKMRVQVVYGVNYSSSGIDEALKFLKLQPPHNAPLPADMRTYQPPPPREKGRWREIAFVDCGQVRDRTPGFPETAEAFADLDLIIIANVPGRAIKAPARLLLQEWVKNAGGGLLLTGGMLAFGKGFVEGSVLEEMLPVETSGVNDTKLVKDGRLAVKNDQALADLLGDTPLATKFYHQTTVKPGATVLIETRDGIPLLVMGAYGKGRVAVWTAMALGSVPEGQVAWWKSDQWPAVLANVIQRLTN